MRDLIAPICAINKNIHHRGAEDTEGVKKNLGELCASAVKSFTACPRDL
jgi:hypothetical protein